MKNLIFVTSAEKKEVRLYNQDIYNNEGWNGEPINYEYLTLDDSDKETDGGFADEVERAIEKIGKEENLRGDFDEYNYDWGSKDPDEIWSF